MARNLLLIGITSGDLVCLSSRVGPVSFSIVSLSPEFALKYYKLWHSLLLAALTIGAVVVISPSKANQSVNDLVSTRIKKGNKHYLSNFYRRSFNTASQNL